ncbi:hypothetical protein ATI53_1003113 [Salipiger aestuarii]|uniref:Uncharacterized protein n=1 Tax=Salipiger aestuarii TaxID=568098 RepID=A0A327YNX7_9RHOB|nr:hypothetical protein ATI53_1003113 [Salipiger aestuarii]
MVLRTAAGGGVRYTIAVPAPGTAVPSRPTYPRRGLRGAAEPRNRGRTWLAAGHSGRRSATLKRLRTMPPSKTQTPVPSDPRRSHERAAPARGRQRLIVCGYAPVSPTSAEDREAWTAPGHRDLRSPPGRHHCKITSPSRNEKRPGVAAGAFHVLKTLGFTRRLRSCAPRARSLRRFPDRPSSSPDAPCRDHRSQAA